MIAWRRTLSEDAFAAKVDAFTLAAILDGATNFAALLQGLPAVYPMELLASLDRLSAKGVVARGLAASIRREAARNRGRVTEGQSLLPLPHPLDFEWRFTSDASRALLERATGMTSPGGDLLLFGTPGLAIEALSLPVDRRVAFLAENNIVTGRVLALNHATGSPLNIAICSSGLPRESADAVILDPPWYLDFVRPMLAAAARACRPGGVVLISLPPEGTRPSAEADRHAAIAFGRRLGLELIEHSALAIGYETPFFERNALAAAGIHPPPHWRRGDLLVFRKALEASRLPIGDTTRRRPWTEVSIGRMRLFIRADNRGRSGEAGLLSLIDGDILPTVSRRHPRRRMAQVWASGNRIFGTNNPQLILEAAILCADGATGSGVQPRLRGTVCECEAVEQVAGDLRALAALEAQEELGAPEAALGRSTRWRSGLKSCWSRSTATTSG